MKLRNWLLLPLVLLALCETQRLHAQTPEVESSRKSAYIRREGNSGPICVVDYPDGTPSCWEQFKANTFAAPQWSPDGTMIVARDLDGTALAVIDVRTGKLTEYELASDCVCWLPDSQRVIFSSQSHMKVFSVSGAPGSQPGPLFKGDILGDCPVASPDGKLIAYTYTEGDKDANIFTIRPDGTDRKQLTAGPDHEFAPLWSPDSRYIAYLQHPNGGFGTRVLVMRLEGNDVHNLTRGLIWNEDIYDQFSWSPDSQHVAFTAHQETDKALMNVYVASADGTTRRTLADQEAAYNFGAAWSPDGKQLAYMAECQNCKSGPTYYVIYVIDVTTDGSPESLGTATPRRLTAATGAEEALPGWQPVPPANTETP